MKVMLTTFWANRRHVGRINRDECDEISGLLGPITGRISSGLVFRIRKGRTLHHALVVSVAMNVKAEKDLRWLLVFCKNHILCQEFCS